MLLVLKWLQRNRRKGAEIKVLGTIHVDAPDAHLDVGKLKSVVVKIWQKVLQREKTGIFYNIQWHQRQQDPTDPHHNEFKCCRYSLIFCQLQLLQEHGNK